MLKLSVVFVPPPGYVKAPTAPGADVESINVGINRVYKLIKTVWSPNHTKIKELSM